ncbi:MAG TPA: D-alanyl-D-alanine carboxypeptidase/D-alanyl-D-alanine-endopeptidase [Burkholderiaceae bacterium]|nr:D-alanyl-D-alanine carboxypeptidase/D-alanyl-D-alanine-endopeptidase [Burkholderiaceae bacterium]
MRRTSIALPTLVWNALAVAMVLATAPTVEAKDKAPHGLPPAVRQALQRADIKPQHAAFVVQPLSSLGKLSVSVNAHAAMNPASTMKLVTTYAALHRLGPAYTWSTEAFINTAVQDGVLDGPLILRGSGDPKLVIENLWLLVQRIRALGITHLKGNVLLDTSAFEQAQIDPGAFDGRHLRPYNAGPDALLVNFKAIIFRFVPDEQRGVAHVITTPKLFGLTAPSTIELSQGACGAWREGLRADFSNPMRPQFKGRYPASCGELIWPVSILTHTAYFEAVFRELWTASGGRWDGHATGGSVDPLARRIVHHESEPLAQIIRDINKFSNNVMARQLLLTLATHNTSGDSTLPATEARGARVVEDTLAELGLSFPELIIDNGAGLSRQAQISAHSLAALLQHAYASAWMPELMSSLPIVGIDGTMKKRLGAVGQAHIKTGLLSNVRAIAGYVLAQSGERYVVVALINDRNAHLGQAAHDALLEWVYREG